MKYKIVQIEWMDVMSLEQCGLMEVEDLDHVHPCTAKIVGFLVKEDDKCYYLAKEMWATGQFKYLHVIPKDTAIIKVKELK